MSDPVYIPLKSVYIRQGINIYGHQNRIYSTGPTWDLHLHPEGTLVRFTHRPDGSVHYISTTALECAEAASTTAAEPAFVPQAAPPPQVSTPQPDSSGLVPNQVRHSVSNPAPVAVAPAQDLDEEVKPAPVQKAIEHEKLAKELHFAAPEPEAAPKKKRGRPRKSPQVLNSAVSDL